MEGEEIRAMVVGMDDDGSRISLSTADLEPRPGDMIHNKVRTYPKIILNTHTYKTLT